MLNKAFSAHSAYSSIVLHLFTQGGRRPARRFRLYTEATFRSLPAAGLPEIQRVSLATLVLQLKQLGVIDVLDFDFLDRPPVAALARALELLIALGALGGDGALSQPLGQRMVRLPVEPVFAKVRVNKG